MTNTFDLMNNFIILRNHRHLNQVYIDKACSLDEAKRKAHDYIENILMEDSKEEVPNEIAFINVVSGVVHTVKVETVIRFIG